MVMDKLIKVYNSLFFILIGAFFCYFYNYHLLYSEQIQIFQFSQLYFDSIVDCPGGFSNYIGSFVYQFYIWNHIGGLILTLLLLLFFHVLNKLFKISWGNSNSLMSSIPIIVASFYFLDLNSNIGAIISMIISIYGSYLIGKIKNDITRHFVYLLLSPVIYLLTGGGLIVYGLLSIISELNKNRNFYFLLLFSFILILIPLLVRFYLIPMNWFDTWIGESFYRGNNAPDYIWLLVLSPCISYLVKSVYNLLLINKKEFFILVINPMVLLGSLFLLFYSIDTNEEIIYKLDFLLKKEKWEELTIVGDKYLQKNILFSSYINIALINSGNISNKLLDFYQNKDVNEFWTPSYLPMFITGETYYYLNMYDAARAYLFMANTQSPLSQSPYIYKQLIKIELIRGNKSVALKYVETLENTLFYSSWARQIKNEILTDSYSDEFNQEIKKYRTEKTFLAKEMIYNITSSLKKKINDKQIDFLLAKQLLLKDYSGFISVFQSSDYGSGKKSGRNFQEFLIMYAYMINDSNYIKRWNISQSVVEDFYNYIQINQSGLSDDEIKENLNMKYGNTYWFYTQYINNI